MGGSGREHRRPVEQVARYCGPAAPEGRVAGSRNTVNSREQDQAGDKPNEARRLEAPGRRAFTLIELAIITAVIAVLVALVLPAMMGPRRHTKAEFCSNNLKQIGLAFRIFANDNEEKLPWAVSTNQGGSREFLDVPFFAFRHFVAMSNELNTPRVILCPQDEGRPRATNWVSVRDNRSLSYFAGLDASGTNPASFLSGDRFLGSTRAPTNGLLTLSSRSLLWWTNSAHAYGGNLAFGDGSVQQLTSRALLQALRNARLATNRLALPLIGP